MEKVSSIFVSKVLTAIQERCRKVYSWGLNLPLFVMLLPNLAPKGGTQKSALPKEKVIAHLPKIIEYNDCIFSPGHNAIYDFEGRRISISALRRCGGYKNAPEKIQVPPISTLEVLDSALYGGLLFPRHYGHFLTESLSRLWPFYFDDQLEDRKIAILFRAASRHRVQLSDIFQGGIDILKAAGLLNQIRIEEKYLVVRRMVIPEQSVALGESIYKVHAKFLQSIGSKLMASAYLKKSDLSKKVYISRSMLPAGDSRKYVNEKKLEKRLSNLGYSIIYPERLPLSEQINVFNNSSRIVGPGGSAFFSMLLVNSSKLSITMFVEDTPALFGSLIDYINVAKASGVKIQAVKCIRNHPLSFNKLASRGDKIVDINGLMKVVEKYDKNKE